MGPYVLDFDQIDSTQIALVGGKAAQLSELSRFDGIHVPPGFCVNTHAFHHITAHTPVVDQLLDSLASLAPDDHESVGALSAELRRAIRAIPIPDDLVAAITRAISRLGDKAPCAVRSSATAEDLPGASFAGQQDSYLNVVGPAAILEHVSRCWASLFTERAVIYRQKNGFDHRAVSMAVVVQRMVFPQASGVMFTADPVTSNRKLVCIDATFGLGEALVAGVVNADVFRVRDDHVVHRAIATKRAAVHGLPDGGTETREIEPDRQRQPALTDDQAVRLAQLGRRIETHFGRPQDIEWCLADDIFHVVQSRPITTLFPIPAAGDAANHVYVSVGHQQMMTDAMKPLGLSFWQATTPAPMAEAGGRLFVDVSRWLAMPANGGGPLELLGRSDPLTVDALQTIRERGDFILPLPGGAPVAAPPEIAPEPIPADPAIVAGLIERNQDSVAKLEREIQRLTGAELLDFMVADIQELKRLLFDQRSHEVILAGMEATWWLNDHLQEWLGERNATDTLTQSVSDNVTSRMGLELLDVADVIRPHAEVIAYLHGAGDDDSFMEKLTTLAGGREARDAIQRWLDRYGMRGVGEIDISRPRWTDRPSALVPLILGNIRNSEPGAAARRFQQGLREAQAKEKELLERLRALPDGDRKAGEAKRMIDRVRTFTGYREYPKYGMISRYSIYRRALLAEAERLVQRGVLQEREDIFHLRLDELPDVLRTGRADYRLISRRQEEFRWHETLTPPRVMTSDGEVLAGTYRRGGLPSGALVGLPVSAGVVEGRARVVLRMADADLEAGDILVTAFTDPAWTPLFVTIAGLVTEVGGLMSHGAVITREYGLPAVVGVADATRLIRDGQRIRVHGTEGYVELLQDMG